VYNGRELISELEKEDYDIVLMDIQMPELNGIDKTKNRSETIAN
jgi:YesN/AraC family two-component response regulator